MALYSNWLLGVLNGTFSTDWDNDTIKVALFAHSASSYVTNSSGYTYWSEIGGQEISGTGYTASGATLGTPSIAFNGHNPTKVKLTGANTSWVSASFTARYAVLYKWTGNASTSPLICWVDFGSNQTVTSATFEIQWNPSGIVEISSSN